MSTPDDRDSTRAGTPWQDPHDADGRQVQPYGGPPQSYAGLQQAPGAHPPASTGPIGTVRSTGLTMLLFVVTFGIWGLVWYYQVHEDMKRHTGQGLGGGIALLIAIFVGIASPYIVSDEVGKLFSRRGQRKPVSAATGLWYFPGVFLLVLPIVWFVKTNGALNAYWRSLGAQ